MVQLKPDPHFGTNQSSLVNESRRIQNLSEQAKPVQHGNSGLVEPELLAPTHILHPKLKIASSLVSCLLGVSASAQLGAFGVRPRILNINWSVSKSLFGVVNSFSPVKMELAPAMKQSACSDMENRTLPADSLTIASGITMRAVAIIRIISHISTG